jgi:hypothetical protein
VLEDNGITATTSRGSTTVLEEKLKDLQDAKSKLPDGPWQTEQDRLEFVTKAGYVGLIQRTFNHLTPPKTTVKPFA